MILADVSTGQIVWALIIAFFLIPIAFWALFYIVTFIIAFILSWRDDDK